MDSSKFPTGNKKLCVVCGGVVECGSTGKDRYGVFLWPKDDKLARIWPFKIKESNCEINSGVIVQFISFGCTMPIMRIKVVITRKTTGI